MRARFHGVGRRGRRQRSGFLLRRDASLPLAQAQEAGSAQRAGRRAPADAGRSE